MANIILIKRGQESNIGNLTLSEGELALAFGADKNSAKLYAGNGDGKVLLNPSNSTQIESAVTEAKDYTDTKIDELVNGAPAAMDTLKEVADAIAENESVTAALNAAIGSKVDKVSGMSLVSASEKNTWNAKLGTSSTIDGGTF